MARGPLLEDNVSQGPCTDPAPVSGLGMRHGCAQPLSPPWSVPSETCAMLSNKCVLIAAQQKVSEGMILIYFTVFLSLLLSEFGAGDIPAD